MGENGAGKSTLIKILGGIYDRTPDRERSDQRAGSQNQYGTGCTALRNWYHPPEISLAENMSIADNLFMGKEIKGGRF